MRRERVRERVKASVTVLFAALILGTTMVSQANNLQLANTVMEQTVIKFDISWENSWRLDGVSEGDGYFHDAVWVFFKARAEGEEEWRHVKLAKAGVNPEGSNGGSIGNNIELVVPEDCMGLFIRRSAEGSGSGTIDSSKVTVPWSYKASGFSMGQKLYLRSYAIEMVYVAEGPFWVGDGLTGFTRTLINTNDATTAAVKVDNKWQGGRPSGQTAPENAEWPNGYNAFYCMKYLITQGQYVDFLNSLTSVQAVLRAYVGKAGRCTIGVSGGVYSADVPDRACNYLSWVDTLAYAAWAGLRPLSELEYEKACRGPLYPVPGEYAWGTDTIVTNLLLLNGVEDGTEIVTNDVSIGAGITYGNSGGMNNLAKRVGIFARPGADRISSGSSYWGITDLSGHLCERSVSISDADGRKYLGSHGQGALDPIEGIALNSDWYETGRTQRGLGWHSTHSSITLLRVSYRNTEASAGGRVSSIGGRVARSAP